MAAALAAAATPARARGRTEAAGTVPTRAAHARPRDVRAHNGPCAGTSDEYTRGPRAGTDDACADAADLRTVHACSDDTHACSADNDLLPDDDLLPDNAARIRRIRDGDREPPGADRCRGRDRQARRRR